MSFRVHRNIKADVVNSYSVGVPGKMLNIGALPVQGQVSGGTYVLLAQEPPPQFDVILVDANLFYTIGGYQLLQISGGIPNIGANNPAGSILFTLPYECENTHSMGVATGTDAAGAPVHTVCTIDSPTSIRITPYGSNITGYKYSVMILLAMKGSVTRV